MSVLVFGVSHRSAPVAVLEQLAADESEQGKLVERVLQSPLVTEAMLLSTCNRVEVYAVVDAFHGGLSVISQVLADHAGMSVGELTKHAYVRYSEAAVEHLFSVTSGLDSAVIGEQQVLGQVRRAYAAAEAGRSVGRILHDLAQRALTAGKRVQAETGIAAAGASVVSVALHIAAERLYRPELGPSYTALTGRTVTVIGAGSMGSLAAALLVRLGVGHVNVVNRSLPRAQRLVQIIAEQERVRDEMRMTVAAYQVRAPGQHQPPARTPATGGAARAQSQSNGARALGSRFCHTSVDAALRAVAYPPPGMSVPCRRCTKAAWRLACARR